MRVRIAVIFMGTDRKEVAPVQVAAATRGRSWNERPRASRWFSKMEP
jgi:hypothetical protein